MNQQSNLVQTQTIEEYLNIKNSSKNYFNQFNFKNLILLGWQSDYCML